MTDNLFIRPAIAGDIAAIDTLLAASYPVLLAADYDAATLAAALPMMAVTRPTLLADRTYFVAVLGTVVVGACGWTAVVPGRDTIIQNRGNIRRLIVDHNRTRMGIAAALMAHTHADAAAAGMTEMYVLSTRTAVPFYQAQGYATRREIDVPLGDTGVAFPSVEMSLSITV